MSKVVDPNLSKLERNLRYNRSQIDKTIVSLRTILAVSVTSETCHRLEGAEPELQAMRTAYADIVRRILELVPDNEFDAKCEALTGEQNDLFEQCRAIVAKCRAAITQFKGKTARESLGAPPLHSTLNESSQSANAYPKIHVPQFDGDYRSFMRFKGIFLNIVHEEESIPPVRKLFYLQSALSGEAARLIEDLPMKPESYGEAWRRICSRYDNQRALVLIYFRELFDIKPLKEPSGVRVLLDKVSNALNNLKLCGLPSENWGDVVAYMVYRCLDSRTRDDFDNTLVASNKFFTWKTLETFLSGRAVTTETRKIAESTKPVFDAKSDKGKPKASYNVSSSYCLACPGSHPLIECPVFASKTPRQRYEVVSQNQRCLNWFGSRHTARDCKRPGCKTCKQSHHTLLHFGESKSTGSRSGRRSLPNPPTSNSTAGSSQNTTDSATSTPPKQGETPVTVSSNCVHSYSTSVSSRPTIVLPSAIVHIRCGDRVSTARILIDCCSQVTLISEDFVHKFRLPTVRSEDSQRISSVSPGVLQPQNCCTLALVSRFKQFELPIVADVVPQTSLMYSLSGVQLPPPESRPKGIRYADPAFLNNAVDVPLVDILVGAEYFEQCVLNQTKPFGSLRLRNTHFGWTVIGPVPNDSSPVFCALVTAGSPAPLRHDIESQLRRFCELEDVSASSEEKCDEKQLCSSHFEETHRRGPDGKFVVRLPLKTAEVDLVDNFLVAQRNLIRSEFSRPPTLRGDYIEFMKEYEDLGHMSPVDRGSLPKPTYFIVHRAVLRPSSTTTKVRVVFNASAVTASEKSLNDLLMIGPKLQPDLFDILLRFRMHLFAFTADIAKMYRCIWVHPEDRHLQCILWRENSDEPIRSYQLNTITYGTAPASFIATKCLEVLSKLLDDPKAEFAVANQFYMDDLLTGADTLQECLSLQQSIHSTLEAAGFVLRKYHSNSPDLLSSIDPSLVEPNVPLFLDGEDASSLLGIYWVPEADVFRLKVAAPSSELTVVSKRRLLSEISKTFDPLGFAAPFTIRAKLFMQRVWKDADNWDDPISSTLLADFSTYWREIPELNGFSVPRVYAAFTSVAERSLIGFSDASEEAYCAVIYMRSVDADGAVVVNLVCAKTRVAPIKKPISVQKLELQAALLLSELAARVASILQFELTEFIAFTDSKVVLAWLAKPASTWKTFVRNRVSKISGLLNFSQWSYVPSKSNPADLATRGLSVSKFLKAQLWFTGPEFLVAESAAPFTLEIDGDCELEKRRPKPLVSLHTNLVDFHPTDFSNFSSFSRLIRTYAFVLRFLNNCKAAIVTKQRSSKVVNVPPLDAGEICTAEKRVIRVVQHTSFPELVSRLLQGAKLKKKSPLLSLNPFLDDQFLLRVGGRIRNADLPYEKRHPVILPAKCHFVVLMVRQLHIKFFHAKKSFLLAHLRAKFWFYGNITSIVKKCVRQCTTCVRYNSSPASQLMGDLPPERVSISRPFSSVGIDFAGPFDVKCVGHRSNIRFKSYIALFVCLSTRALHLEVVSELTTDAFLLCLSRFIARRGRPHLIWSDNGTNFVGAKHYLDLSDPAVANHAADNGMSWRLNPARAPHRGGIWEAAVKAMKSCLLHSTQGQTFTFEELSTLICRVESMLNSRPLCSSVNADQGDMVITPGHFLIGASLQADPEPPKDSVRLAKRYEIVRRSVQAIWKIWSKAYLSQLQSRSKWQSPVPNIKSGCVVLVKEDNLPPNSWKYGRVVDVFPDSQGLVRTAQVQFDGKVWTRSISSLILLPVEEDDR